jgi:hypothetical protein
MSLSFDSAPLDEDLTILGTPQVTLRLAVDKPQAMIAVRLTEVTPDGHSSRLTFGLLNLSHRRSSETPEPMTPGKTEEVTVKLNDVAYRFRKGNRIRIAVSTSYWPMVWPSPETVALSLHTAGSQLLLPVRADTVADDALQPFEPVEMASDHGSREIEPSITHRERTTDIATGTSVLHHVEDTGKSLIEDIDLIVQKRSEETFSITPEDPTSARTDMVRIVRAERGNWKPRTETRLTFACDVGNFHITATLEAFEGDNKILERTWDEKIPRDHM